jgi:hypothetical protein
MIHFRKMATILAVFALTAAPALAGASELGCDPATLLLRHVTIIDASGQWDDQDILIEDGRISAVGSALELNTSDAVTEIDGQGAIVRPRPDETVRLFIRTSTAQPSTMMILPGVPADLLVSVARTREGVTGRSDMEIRGGRIAGSTDTCLAG